MAKTTKKLASTFKARRFRVAVSHGQLTEAYNRCVDMGLIPKPVSFGAGDRSDIKISFAIVVPCKIGVESWQTIWTELTHTLEDTSLAVSDDGWTDLICPPPEPELTPEPCTVGKRLGTCPECGGVYSLIGPIQEDAGKPKFIMKRHPRHKDTSGATCAGSYKEIITLRGD